MSNSSNFPMFTSSIFSISFVQNDLFDFRNDSISSITQISSSLEAETVVLLEEEKRVNMTRNDDLLNNLAVQTLINQIIVNALIVYNAQLNINSSIVDSSNLVDSANQQDFLDQQDVSRSSKSFDNDTFAKSFAFRAFDLEYFHSNLEEFYEKSDIVITIKKTIYREIYIFCRRIQDYSNIVRKERVRMHLSTCFSENALS